MEAMVTSGQKPRQASQKALLRDMAHPSLNWGLPGWVPAMLGAPGWEEGSPHRGSKVLKALWKMLHFSRKASGAY